MSLAEGSSVVGAAKWLPLGSPSASPPPIVGAHAVDSRRGRFGGGGGGVLRELAVANAP